MTNEQTIDPEVSAAMSAVKPCWIVDFEADDGPIDTFESEAEAIELWQIGEYEKGQVVVVHHPVPL
jgi:hypothetical protein